MIVPFSNQTRNASQRNRSNSGYVSQTISELSFGIYDSLTLKDDVHLGFALLNITVLVLTSPNIDLKERTNCIQ